MFQKLHKALSDMKGHMCDFLETVELSQSMENNGSSWDELPVEIRDMILRFVARSTPQGGVMEVSLSLVCHSWNGRKPL